MANIYILLICIRYSKLYKKQTNKQTNKKKYIYIYILYLFLLYIDKGNKNRGK